MKTFILLVQALQILYNGVPPFWPIFSATSTPIYKLPKFLTLNEYTIKDSFLFAEEPSNYVSNMIMASFDVASLFSSISLQESIDLSLELLYNGKHNIDGFIITDFHELLTITTSELLA